MIRDFLSRDHDRLDALLQRCIAAGDPVPLEPYEELRSGLLRHIAIEEKVLFPFLRSHRGATELEARLHRDHAALAALLVPSPKKEWLAKMAQILEEHNPLEEEAEGLYEIIESLEESADLRARVEAVPQVRVAPHSDAAVVFRSIEQLLRERRGDRRG